MKCNQTEGDRSKRRGHGEFRGESENVLANVLKDNFYREVNVLCRVYDRETEKKREEGRGKCREADRWP